MRKTINQAYGVTYRLEDFLQAGNGRLLSEVKGFSDMMNISETEFLENLNL